MRYDDLNQKEYELVEQLRGGPLGRTYLARQRSLGRYVLIRHLAAAGPDAPPRFANELEAIATLRHPHNAHISDVGAATISGIPGPYMVSPYIPGESLETVLGRVEKLETAQILRLGRQLLGALAEAHRHGLLHRQLRPACVWLAQHDALPDHVIVFDHALEQALDPQAWWQTLSNDSGDVSDYAAPEVLAGEPPTERSDLYSAAAVLYHAIVGKHYSDAHDTQLDLRGPVADALSSLREELLEVVDRALEPVVERRFASAAEFLDALAPIFERAHAAALVPASLSTFAQRPAMARRDDEPYLALTDHPSIWVLADDPAIGDEVLTRLRHLAAHYRILDLTREASRDYADALLRRDIKQPWVLIFGDLHVILQIRVLRAVRELLGTQKILLSAKLNAQMLEASVNFCGVDQHVILPVDDATLQEAVETRIAMCRRQIERQQALGLLQSPEEPARRESITGRFAATTR